MKRVIIAIIFITLSIVVGIYSMNETTSKCNRMMSRIEKGIKESTELQESNNHDKKIEFYNSMESLNDAWEENSKFFYFFFNNDEIRDIEINIEKLPTHAKCGNIEEANLCLVEALEDFEYLKNSSVVNLNNIF